MWASGRTNQSRILLNQELSWRHIGNGGSNPFKAKLIGRAHADAGLVCICMGDVDQLLIRVAMQPPKPD